MQLSLKTLLHTQLADVVGATVVGLLIIWPVFHRFFFSLIDAPDVADDVAGQLTIGVGAKQARLDLHAGKAITLGGELGHLFVRQAGADRQRVEISGLLHQFPETPPVACRDVNQT